MIDFPTAADLAAQGATLERDVCLWSALLRRESVEAEAEAEAADLPPPPKPRRPASSTPRTFASKYVGVTIHHDRWLAQWGPRGAKKGRVFPLTPAGELLAATERARALGLDAPQMRA